MSLLYMSRYFFAVTRHNRFIYSTKDFLIKQHGVFSPFLSFGIHFRDSKYRHMLYQTRYLLFPKSISCKYHILPVTELIGLVFKRCDFPPWKLMWVSRRGCITEISFKELSDVKTYLKNMRNKHKTHVWLKAFL